MAYNAIIRYVSRNDNKFSALPQGNYLYSLSDKKNHCEPANKLHGNNEVLIVYNSILDRTLG